ncbi:MAG TPA: tRNA dihydrouridine synthase DusB [Candidatus Latescibacteria bacterium]|nr:tRNA dihydrouridine synthase DusB [Gemmatimonadota bacterium]HCR18220.1 tRNA dihydrouridine synthase DusB [Candidatus Latescibacterota bacterium]
MAVMIGDVRIDGRTVLAPLAGVTDRSFRLLCREQGASLAVTEMVSARGLAEGSERSSRFLDFDEAEHPISVQIFGSEPGEMADGARVAEEQNPDLIDINCGCPVKKIVNRNAGSALLKDLPKLGRIISSMCRAVSVPVTLKIRSGWQDATEATEVARVAEDAGAAAIAVHGRTREARFSGDAAWDVIRDVRDAVAIPVIGNGDARDPVSASKMINETGCELVMIGRWAMGNPWLFGRTETLLETGELLPEPSVSERVAMAIRHLSISIQVKGVIAGVREMRGHLAAYVKGMPGAASLRQELMTQDDPDKVEEILRGFLYRMEATQSITEEAKV